MNSDCFSKSKRLFENASKVDEDVISLDDYKEKEKQNFEFDMTLPVVVEASDSEEAAEKFEQIVDDVVDYLLNHHSDIKSID